MPKGSHVNSIKTLLLYNVHKRLKNKITKDELKKLIDSFTHEELKQKGITQKLIHRVEGRMIDEDEKEREERDKIELEKAKSRVEKRDEMKQRQAYALDLAEKLDHELNEIMNIKDKYNIRIDPKLINVVNELQKITPTMMESTQDYISVGTKSIGRKLRSYFVKKRPLPTSSTSTSTVATSSLPVASVVMTPTAPITATSTSITSVSPVQPTLSSSSSTEQPESKQLKIPKVNADNILQFMDMFGQAMSSSSGENK